MGLEKKLDETKAMVCTPKLIWVEEEELAYKRWVTGEGATFREREKGRSSCATCGVTVVESYLKDHTVISHGICVPQTRRVHEVVGGLTTNMVSFPKVLQEVRCPVPGCS